MKKILVAIALCLILVCLMVSPVLAAPTDHVYGWVNGMEFNAGTFDGTNTNNAHFTAYAIMTSRPFSSGILDVYVNYLGNGPKATGDLVNTITGGKWTFTPPDAHKGMISGIIDNGYIKWENFKNSATGRGLATINLSITDGTGDFAKIAKGSGSTFTGYDVHMSGFWIGNTQVPFVKDGTLKLVY